MRKGTTNICVYCGLEAELTSEHVIPKCLFPKPLPTKMITVGTCYSCNNGKSLDDTYVRDYLLADLAAEKSPIAQQLRTGKFKRSVQTNRSEIARAVLKRIYRKPLFTPGGIYLGSPLAVPVEQQRLELSFERMVRGLYYHVWKDHLRRNYAFEVSRIDGFHTAAVWTEMKAIGASIAAIRPDVFACQYVFARQDLSVSRWLLLFYNTIIIEVLTLPPNGIEALIAEAEASPGSVTGTGAFVP